MDGTPFRGGSRVFEQTQKGPFFNVYSHFLPDLVYLLCCNADSVAHVKSTVSFVPRPLLW